MLDVLATLLFIAGIVAVFVLVLVGAAILDRRL